MESPLNSLTATLKRIRDQADAALRIVDQSDRRSLAWKCKACGYVKHFTRPATADAASRCPRCKGEAFEPV